MLGTADVVPGGLDTARPDLPIPLHPLPRPAEWLRRALVWLREPSFVRASEVTSWWAIATFVVLAASQLPLSAPIRPWLVGTGIVMAVYLMSRIAVLTLTERWQREYESSWLDARSHALRNHAFPVIRFTVRPDARLRAEGERTQYLIDLTNPEHVRHLRDLQASDAASGTRTRVVIEFAYRPEGQKNPAVERVKRQLKDLTFAPVRGTLSQAYVRFPRARYAARPAMTRRGQGRPGQVTYWLLREPVTVTVGGG